MFLKIKEGSVRSVLATHFRRMEPAGHLDMSVDMTPDCNELMRELETLSTDLRGLTLKGDKTGLNYKLIFHTKMPRSMRWMYK